MSEQQNNVSVKPLESNQERVEANLASCELKTEQDKQGSTPLTEPQATVSQETNAGDQLKHSENSQQNENAENHAFKSGHSEGCKQDNKNINEQQTSKSKIKEDAGLDGGESTEFENKDQTAKSDSFELCEEDNEVITEQPTSKLSTGDSGTVYTSDIKCCCCHFDYVWKPCPESPGCSYCLNRFCCCAAFTLGLPLGAVSFVLLVMVISFCKGSISEHPSLSGTGCCLYKKRTNAPTYNI